MLGGMKDIHWWLWAGWIGVITQRNCICPVCGVHLKVVEWLIFIHGLD